MNIEPYYDAALFENRFWLQIMGDHARFIFYALAPTESEYILTAQQFIIQFDELLKRSHQSPTNKELDILIQEAYQAALRFRELKLELLGMSLNSDLQSHLSPSVYNGMVNELDEYLQILKALQANQPILLQPMHYHMLWLSDAVLHASSIIAGLDASDLAGQDHALRYRNEFQQLYLKSLTINGYLRTNLAAFPSLTVFHEQTANTVMDYIEYLDKLSIQRTDNKILGTLTALEADHMLRESCYYLKKLSQITDIIRHPDCDPTRPRPGI